MTAWKQFFSSSITKIEDTFDSLVLRVSDTLGLDEPLMIRPYIGYGTADKVRIKGRVLENDNILEATDQDGVWENILNAYRQLESDEVPGATVEGRFAGITETTVTDEEGFFELEFRPQKPLSGEGVWHDVSLKLLDAPLSYEGDVEATGRILVAPQEARFGVISDIDDTVLQSSATDYLNAARLLLLHNARTRLPFKGVATFYKALQRGTDGSVYNPLLYVSSSPWNIFPLLTDFFKFQKIPLGPMFLKDYGISKDQLLFSGHGKHKLAKIGKIINIFADLPFVLIGDSGQLDPEIYAKVVRRYPDRVRAIYIRDVTEQRRDEEVKALIAAVEEAGVPMRLVSDSYQAAEHAASIGLIDSTTVAAVAEEVRKEEQRPLSLDEIA